MKTRDITVIGIMTAISVVISIIESYFTFISDFIPGLKLGLSNIVIIYVLYKDVIGFSDDNSDEISQLGTDIYKDNPYMK